mmetsp:Transcript_24320/g.30161  ORF Transcript_24320/g.30161 Transcript_24320/m.30161 type:complete len:126 (-) Transcript_24320:119-496(-)|eukprot:CAMPEP_0170470228 /NCGR_PEP_ID=MMETSP0123-20130129/12754_1 /TAXON_ID=182087 /ORGANISM="Favella ehrenbergii, Strain Fehren 1" /LENGTH=125 /DNA_ID=CAMNT_0010737279 /DNA_START=61 /DNA_END=438 /DNA_ORIENTATION=+
MEEIPEDFVEEIRQTFRLFDENNDGNIDEKELGNVFRSLGQHYTQAELAEMIAEIDSDGSGVIEFSEFLQLMRRRMRDTDTEEEMVEAFKVFDRDGDGLICLKDLKQVMRQIGENLPEQECINII